MEEDGDGMSVWWLMEAGAFFGWCVGRRTVLVWGQIYCRIEYAEPSY